MSREHVIEYADEIEAEGVIADQCYAGMIVEAIRQESMKSWISLNGQYPAGSLSKPLGEDTCPGTDLYHEIL